LLPTDALATRTIGRSQSDKQDLSLAANCLSNQNFGEAGIAEQTRRGRAGVAAGRSHLFVHPCAPTCTFYLGSEKVTVPVSGDILAEVDDVMHLGPEGTVDYVLRDFIVHVQARRAGLARARELAAEGPSTSISSKTRAVTAAAACEGDVLPG
jgi:hypothetical protein